MDVLPPDGMQEVSGSSPLSSTGQKRNPNGSNSEYSSKVPQPGSLQIPHVFGLGSSEVTGCWRSLSSPLLVAP